MSGDFTFPLALCKAQWSVGLHTPAMLETCGAQCLSLGAHMLQDRSAQSRAAPLRGLDPLSFDVRLPEEVMLHAGGSVLILPRTGRFDAVGDKVLVAWHGTGTARRRSRCAALR
ncbi:hypothetical protein [Variovorax paradoxus]|uniref:hypothetical protein n=1 Tax=Variovorax paradoxus TaxID=34073 RepID=UPI00078609FC|nr:hypothetical protein [Variovorax paradoxus]